MIVKITHVKTVIQDNTAEEVIAQVAVRLDTSVKVEHQALLHMTLNVVSRDIAYTVLLERANVHLDIID